MGVFPYELFYLHVDTNQYLDRRCSGSISLLRELSKIEGLHW